MKKLLSILLLLYVQSASAQNTGIIRGKLVDKNTQETLIGATVLVESTNSFISTDLDGNYKLELPIGTYNVKAIYLGYITQIKFNIPLSSGNAQTVNFELEPLSSTLSEVTVTFDKGKSAVATDMITPLSVQQLTTEEIKSNPGGGFDVSKVVQTLPGVGGIGGGAPRNDIIVRGGAPNENVYYVDGIEIPVLNHFQTQGSSGGAQGILNVSFIEDLKLSSSAFDARYDNALASTFIIKQRQGNPEKYSGNLRVSLTETAATLEGPLGKKSNFLFSARKSYLDLLFQLIDLPIRPNFGDYQFKISNKLNERTSLTTLVLTSVDKFKFAQTTNFTPESEYIRRSQPFINQWSYTTGVALKRLVDKGFVDITLSRNMFNNELDKFLDPDNTSENTRTFQLKSQEIENKFRIDVNKFIEGWKFSYGAMAQYVKYNNQLFNKIKEEERDSSGNIISPAIILNSDGDINFFKYGAFGQVAKNIFKNKLLVSLGIRTDMNTFLLDGNNPLNALSPRLSFSYHLNPKMDLTASVGQYYKIPTYTTLGYRNEKNELANKSMKYIASTHYVLGTQFLPKESLRLTVEGFYKQYSNYPVSLNTGSSIANDGLSFGAIGNEPILSSGKGTTYGLEFFIQQKLVKNIFYVFSYTYVRSLFSGLDGKLIASSWDNRNLVSTTLGYKFKRNWDLGLKYRLSGGNPYTPFDMKASREDYALTGQGTLDYSNLNSERLKTFTQLDLRLDKKYFWKKTSLDIFIDISNVLMSAQESRPNYTFKRKSDNSGFETTDGKALQSDGSNAIPVILKNESTLITPTIGFMFEF